MQTDLATLRDFAARYTAAWCSQEAENVSEFYSPAGTLTVNNNAPAVGRRAIAELARSFMTAFPDMRVVMDGLLVQTEGVHYQWTLTGTNTGPNGTGKGIRISGLEIWQFGTDGLIASSQGHFDTAEYQRQLKSGE